MLTSQGEQDVCYTAILPPSLLTHYVLYETRESKLVHKANKTKKPAVLREIQERGISVLFHEFGQS